MKLTDEEIQRLLEKELLTPGKAGDSENDVTSYRLLFNALKKEPPGGLPYDFAAKLTRQLQSRKNRASDIKFYLLAIILPIAFLAGAYGVLNVFDTKTAALLGDTLLKYKWAFIFVLGGFLLVQYFDQKLVKENEGS